LLVDTTVVMKGKVFIVMIVSVALVCLGQGLWQTSYAQKKSDEKTGTKGTKVRIRKETGPVGHQTIGIDEDSVVLDSKKAPRLKFGELMKWKYRIGDNPSPPEAVKDLDGRRFQIVGFMYPLQEGAAIQYFCIIRTTQTCCYGPRPEYNQYVFVEMEKPTTFYRLDPVACTGKFRVDPSPDEGFIYRMEGEACEPMERKEDFKR